MRFSLPSIKRLAAPPSFRDYCRAHSNQIIEHSSETMADVLEDAVLGSSRKLGGVAAPVFGGCEKRICRLSPHVIEMRSNILSILFCSSQFGDMNSDLSRLSSSLLINSRPKDNDTFPL